MCVSGVPETPRYTANGCRPQQSRMPDYDTTSKKPLCQWYFDTPKGETSVTIQPARSCDNGEQIKQWAIEGGGIALKSIWDVVDELNSGLLIPVLEKYTPDYNSKSSYISSDLYIAYQDREYVPSRQAQFTKCVKQYFDELKSRSDILQNYLAPIAWSR